MKEKMPERNIPDIIKQLKKVQEERGLKISDILQMTHDYADEHKTGIYPSEASVRRLFAKESETQSFDYDRTIQPVARVLLWMYEDDKFNPDHAQIYFEQRNRLQHVVNLHSAEEKRLQKYINEQEERHNADIIQLKTEREEKLLELKTMYLERCGCQEHTISLLETDNAFYRKTIDSLLATLETDRQSKLKLYNEVQKLNEEIKKLKAYHEG